MQHEYEILNESIHDFVQSPEKIKATLNQMGKNGWELVNSQSSSQYPNAIQFIFKRKIG